MKFSKFYFLIFLSPPCWSCLDPLDTPAGYLKYDIKKVMYCILYTVHCTLYIYQGASLDPDHQSIGYWNGSVYGWTLEGSEPVYEKLFLFEGFNVRRVYQEEDGHYVSLSREVSVYRQGENIRHMILYMRHKRVSIPLLQGQRDRRYPGSLDKLLHSSRHGGFRCGQ